MVKKDRQSLLLALVLSLLFAPLLVNATIIFETAEEVLQPVEPMEMADRARDILAKQPNSGRGHEMLGEALVKMGRIQEAIEVLERGTKLAPGRSGLWTKLGIIQMETGNIDLAQKSLFKAIELEPDDRFAHQRIGYLYEHRNDIPRAIHHFQKGLEGASSRYLGISVNLGRLLNLTGRYRETIALLLPRLPLEVKDPVSHAILATAYLKAGQHEQSLARFERFLELQPKSPEARLGIAMAQRGLGKAKASLQLLDQLIAERPDWGIAYGEKGVTLLALNQLKKALTVFERASKLGMDRSILRRHVANYHLKNKAFNKARPIYEELIRDNKAVPATYTQLSELQLAQGMRKEGELSLRQGLERFPNSGYLHLRLGSYLASLRAYTEAAPLLEKAVKLTPNDPQALKTYSLVQLKSGDTRGAVKTAEKLYKLTPNYVQSGILYGSLLEQNGRNSDAEKVYRGVLKKDQGNVLALNNLANVLMQRDKLTEAEKLSRQANNIIQDDGNIKDTLGWILFKQGKLTEAAKLLEQASALAPKIASIRYHEGVVFSEQGQHSKAKVSLTAALDMQADAVWAGDARKRLKGIH